MINFNPKIVFWTPCDPIVLDYLSNNKSIEYLANRYEYYFVCSNGIEKTIKFKKSKILICRNHMMEKFVCLHQYLKHIRFKALIRLDADTIVFKPDLLINLANRIEKYQLYGQTNKLDDVKLVLKDPCKYDKLKMLYPNLGSFVYGGCQIAGSNIVTNNFKTIDDFKDSEFDAVFTIQLQMQIVFKKLFEISDQYSEVLPAWHPKPNNKKTFFKEISKF